MSRISVSGVFDHIGLLIFGDGGCVAICVFVLIVFGYLARKNYFLVWYGSPPILRCGDHC